MGDLDVGFVARLIVKLMAASSALTWKLTVITSRPEMRNIRIFFLPSSSARRTRSRRHIRSLTRRMSSSWAISTTAWPSFRQLGGRGKVVRQMMCLH